MLFPAGETSIEPRGERMRADGQHRFYNPEFEKNLTVGFLTLPYIPAHRQLDTRLEPNIRELRAEVNGEPVGVYVKPMMRTSPIFRPFS